MSFAYLALVVVVSNGCAVFRGVVVMQFQLSALLHVEYLLSFLSLLPRKVVLQWIMLGIYIFTYVNYFLESIFESRINGSKGLNIFMVLPVCVYCVIYCAGSQVYCTLHMSLFINLKPEEGICKPFYHFVLLINSYYLVFIVRSSKHFMCIMQELIQTLEQPDGGAVSSVL